jgi:tetratricopeptide (TPR) repeat protein
MLERAKAALIARDYSLAAKIYKNLILEEPENVDYKMQLGNLYVKAGKDDQALTLFKQVEKVDNENLDALIAISGIYRRQKKFEESVAFLEQALVICEENPRTRAKISYNLGFTYRQMGNYDEAIKCFEEVVEDNPSDVLANNHLGAIYAFKGNHTKAIEAYNRGLKYDANHPILQFNIAKSYAEIGEISKAQSFYEGALRAKPGWTEAIEAYADLLLDENKVAEADTAVTQALELYPDDVRMHTAKGNVYNRQSIFVEAENEYKKALEVDENYKNALTGLATSLEKQEKYDEAIETISKAESLNPTDERIMKQAAHIHISANKLEAAYEKIVKLQNLIKNDVQTINLLGQYYIRKNDAVKAEECFANIKKINPDYNEIYRDWAERLIQQGDDKRAEPYLHAAIQKNPNDSTAMVHLGKIYERQSQVGKALQFFKKATAADSFNHLSKVASDRILENNESLARLDAEGLFSTTPIDFDALFSGGKVSAETENVDEQKTAENAENPVAFDEEPRKDVLSSVVPDGLLSETGEISLAENDSRFNEEVSESDIALPVSEADDDFNFEQFGSEKLASASSAASDDIESVANLLETSENAFDDNRPAFDELIDDGAPLDEEDGGAPALVSIPDGTEYIEESKPYPHEPQRGEVERPKAQKREISEESLDQLEEQIKRASELAEKANYAAESAWQAATQAADAAQAVEESKKMPVEVYEVQKEAEKIEEPFDDDAVIEPRNEEEMISDLPEEDFSDIDETITDEDLLAAEELLNEDDISGAETEDDDFLDDIPDYLQEEEQEKLAESEETEENGSTDEIDSEESEEFLEDEIAEEQMEDTTEETKKPKVDDLALRRAIDMLPSIIAAIEDRSVIYRFRSFLSMFKTLREMLEYLPPEQRHEFMTSRNRLLLDYVISKLSGKPGLFATTKALLRSGLIHENPENKPSEKDGIELVREVLGNLRELSGNLEDETLKKVINAEADTLEKAI